MSTETTAGKKERVWPTWAQPFLDQYREHRSVANACRAVHKDKTTIYHLRRDSESFAAEMAEIQSSIVTDLEESAMTRAILGGMTITSEPDASGKMVEKRRVRSPETTLTIFMLKVHGDRRYRFEGEVLEHSAAQFARSIHLCIKAGRESVPDPDPIDVDVPGA